MLQVLFFSRGRYKNLWTITCTAFLLLQDAIRGCWALSKMWVHCDRCVWKVNWAGICWNWTYTTRYFLSKNSKGTQGPLPCFWTLLFLSSIRPQVFEDVWCGQRHPTINKSFSFPIQKSDGSNERIFWNLSVKETLFHISFRWLRALGDFPLRKKDLQTNLLLNWNEVWRSRKIYLNSILLLLSFKNDWLSLYCYFLT